MNGRWRPEGSAAVMPQKQQRLKTKRRKRTKKYGAEHTTKNVFHGFVGQRKKARKKIVLTLVSGEKLSETACHVCRQKPKRVLTAGTSRSSFLWLSGKG